MPARNRFRRRSGRQRRVSSIEASPSHEFATGQPAANARRRALVRLEVSARSARVCRGRCMRTRMPIHGLLGRTLGRLLSSWKIPGFGKRFVPRFCHSVRIRCGAEQARECRSGARVPAANSGLGSARQRKRAMRVRSKPSLDVCDADLIACTLRAPEQRLVRRARHRAARNDGTALGHCDRRSRGRDFR